MCTEFLKYIISTCVGGAITFLTSYYLSNTTTENDKRRFLALDAITSKIEAESCVEDLISEMKQFARYIKIENQVDNKIINKNYNSSVNNKINRCESEFNRLELYLVYTNCLKKNEHINFDFISDLKKEFNSAVRDPGKYNGRWNTSNKKWNIDISEKINDAIIKKGKQKNKIFKIMEDCIRATS